jgi:ubiquinone/menaquinone biosynthesis C-methylase UbiE
MGFYSHHVLPRMLDFTMRQKVLRPFRDRIVGAAEGRVLEIGLGSGLNLPLYGANVRSVIGLDPSPELLTLARRYAAAVPIELIEGSADALPLEDRSVDTVVTTWTLCTISNVGRALAEARRVLRSSGSLLFIEHGRAPEPGVARWQDRFDPIWCRIAGGCHLNRQIDALVRQAGFRIDRLQTSRIPGPRTHTFLYEGRAAP